MTTIRRLIADESGATAIEYGLIAGLVAVAIIAALGFLGEQLSGLFEFMGDTVQGAIARSVQGVYDSLNI